MSTELEYEIDEGVAVIRLNRPHRMNAFTEAMLDLWTEALIDAAANPVVRVVVVTGSGRAFCSGVDLELLPRIRSSPAAAKEFLTRNVHQVARAVEQLDKPLIAAINGSAVGAGLDMALMCDMRFAASSATMSEAYIRHGLVPGDGGCYFLPRLVGPAKALELLLGGDTIGAEEALRIGMVNRVYPDAGLMPATREFALQLAGHAPLAVQLIKRTTYQSLGLSMAASLDLVSSHFGLLAGAD